MKNSLLVLFLLALDVISCVYVLIDYKFQAKRSDIARYFSFLKTLAKILSSFPNNRQRLEGFRIPTEFRIDLVLELNKISKEIIF